MSYRVLAPDGRGLRRGGPKGGRPVVEEGPHAGRAGVEEGKYRDAAQALLAQGRTLG